MRRSVSSAISAVERVILPGSGQSADDCQDVDEAGTEPSSDAASDLFGLDWSDGGKELLAFVDSGAVDNVLPMSVRTEYPLEGTSKSQSGVVFKGANGSHIKHCGQRRFRVKTSAGSNMNNTWVVADVRKPLISASRLLDQCKSGDTIPLERTGSLFAVWLWIPKGFHMQE